MSAIFVLANKAWQKTVKFIKSIKTPAKFIIRYSGIEFIYRKFVPPRNSETLPTGFIWLFGLYIALFGIAFNRYESRTVKIDNLIDNITVQLLTERRFYALSRIRDIQWQPCPLKPIIFNPVSVFLSLFGEDRQYEEMADYLKNIVVDHRSNLNSVNLGYCDLRGALFQGGNFEKTILMYSKLDQAVFAGVNFKNAQFFNAKFNNAWFTECNFEGADLLSVNLEGTFFSKCNLEAAKGIELDQLVKCRSLYQCKLKPTWLEVLKRDYPKKLEWPDGYSTDEIAILKKRILPPYFEKIFREHSSD